MAESVEKTVGTISLDSRLAEKAGYSDDSTAKPIPRKKKNTRKRSHVPSGSPDKLSVIHRQPTTAELSWTPVPNNKQNGVITGYTVQVVEADSTSKREIPVDKDATSVEISNLKPSTKYMFNVSAKTKAGSGPTASISSTTPEDTGPSYQSTAIKAILFTGLSIVNAALMYKVIAKIKAGSGPIETPPGSTIPKGHWYQSTASKAILFTALSMLILSTTVAVLYSYKTDSQTIREHEKSFSPQPKCSWNEFKQTAELTRIEKLNDLRWSVEIIGDWQSLCRNLDVNEADMNRIMNERDHPKDECLNSYFDSDEAYWEEVVIAVARPPFNNKHLAKTIAEKHLEHSPNKDTILTMIKSCVAYY